MKSAWLAVVGLALLGAGAASAQYENFANTRQQQMEPGARPSIRLLGMGGLGLTVADEDNKISLLDFGSNLAGMLEDRDASSLECWGGRVHQLDDYVDPSVSASGRLSASADENLAGAEVVYRKPGHRALGVIALYDAQENSVTLGNDGKLSGPNGSVFWNEAVGRFSGAIRLGTWGDNQHLVTTDVFGIGNSSSGSVATLAASWKWHTWTVGGQLEWDRSLIHGVSADPGGFHDDEFNWNRPVTRLQLNLIRPESNRLAAGINLTSLRIDGSEDGRYSWSDRFASNPSRLNYLIYAPTFQEKVRNWGLEGRCRYALDRVFKLGAYASYQGLKYEIDADPSGNFPGSLLPQNTDTKDWKLGAGLGGTFLRERLRLGVEGYYEGEKVSSILTRATSDVKMRDLAVRAGAELLLPSRVSLRAGFQGGTLDEDTEQPYNFYKNSGFTVGLGYAPLGGIVRLDAALRILQQRPGYSGGGSDRKTWAQEMEAGARFLF